MLRPYKRKGPVEPGLCVFNRVFAQAASRPRSRSAIMSADLPDRSTAAPHPGRRQPKSAVVLQAAVCVDEGWMMRVRTSRYCEMRDHVHIADHFHPGIVAAFEPEGEYGAGTVGAVFLSQVVVTVSREGRHRIPRTLSCGRSAIRQLPGRFRNASSCAGKGSRPLAE